MQTIEKTILRNLIHKEDYMRKVLPFLKGEYFSRGDAITYNKIVEFVDKFNKAPTVEAIEIACQNDKNITEELYEEITEGFVDLKPKEAAIEWLLEETEKFCKERAVHNALLKSVNIIEGKEKESKDAIPSILQDALAVCFDTSVGHDYFDDAEARYDFYTRKENKLEFDLDMFNKITNGGIPNKTLNVLMASTGVGKSLFMCHFATAWLKQGKNVLYITLEMAEERIAERIDANMLDVAIDQLANLPKETFENRVQKVLNKTKGKLIVKEYPTAAAHVNHFRTLLNELQLKRNFRPDVIFVDYLNICASSRFKPGSNVNSYTIVKAIAEELRGLAVEFNVPVISATQTNRSGYNNTDIDLTDTSESMGLPMSVDLMVALIATEELEQMNQVMVKQLKNRYNDPTKYKRFVVGIDRPKMRLYDLEDTAQNDIQDAGRPHDSQLKEKFSMVAGTIGRAPTKFSDERFKDIKVS